MKQKDILLILISISIIVLAWIGFSIYHNLITSTIPEVLNVQISPIKPTFDTKTISELKTRTKVEPVFELRTSVTPTPTTSSAQLEEGRQ